MIILVDPIIILIKQDNSAYFFFTISNLANETWVVLTKLLIPVQRVNRLCNITQRMEIHLSINRLLQVL